jgi:hypothetical protein
MKAYKAKELYSKKYKQYLPWSKAMWIVRAGDKVLVNDKVQLVQSVELKPIHGAIPTIIVGELDDDNP